MKIHHSLNTTQIRSDQSNGDYKRHGSTRHRAFGLLAFTGMLIFIATGCKEDDDKVGCKEGDVIADTSCTCYGADYQGKCIIHAITMGNYYQSGNESKEQIEWRVLSIDKEERKMLVLSEYILDAKPYHDTEVTEITWENSSLRKWLNEDFINAAFTKEERETILNTSLKNLENPISHMTGGNNTEDRIFPLSLGDVLTSNDSITKDDNSIIHGNEVEGGHYFPWSSRTAKVTQYALDQFDDVYFTLNIASGDHLASNRSVCAHLQCTAKWWLRSPGTLGNTVNSVLSGLNEGDVLVTGQVYSHLLGVRPAMWIKY